MAEFVRLAEVVNKKKDMRIVSVTVIPTIADCSGRIWFTDLQLQEGSALSGYAPHTEVCLQKCRENGGIKPPVWFNGVVRDGGPFQHGENIRSIRHPHLPKIGHGGGDGAACPGRGRPEGVFSRCHESRG